MMPHGIARRLEIERQQLGRCDLQVHIAAMLVASHARVFVGRFEARKTIGVKQGINFRIALFDAAQQFFKAR